MCFIGQMRNHAPWVLAIIALVFLVYSLFSFGGIRSPDGEVYFRTCQALVASGTFAVEDLADLNDFGLAQGTDGRRYSIFGPGLSLTAAPWLWVIQTVIGEHLNASLGTMLPFSHYQDQGLKKTLTRSSEKRNTLHVHRSLTSFFNVFISSLNVGLFFLFLRSRFSRQAAAFTSLLYAFATPAWWYSGTFFSEPLQIFWLLAAFLLLSWEAPKTGMKPSAWSGSHTAAFFCLGMAVVTHVSAILFLPFAWFWRTPHPGLPETPRSFGSSFITAFLGVFPPLFLLGWHHFSRFGNPLETGRTAVNMVSAGFVPPWEGAAGLLFSPGKGLFWFCPIALVAVIALWQEWKEQRRTAAILAGMFLVRWGFIAMRSDWPGGFSLGPRYLVPLLPFLLYPIAGLWERINVRSGRPLLLFGAILVTAAIAQQAYFVTGELFLFFHLIKWQFLQSGLNPFADNLMYWEWSASPLFPMLQLSRGPWLLRSFPGSNLLVVILGTVGIVLFGGILITAAEGRTSSPSHASTPSTSPTSPAKQEEHA